MNINFLKPNQKKNYKTCKKNFLMLFMFLSFFSGLNALHGIENQSTGMDANGSTVVVWQEDTGLGTEIKSSALPYTSFAWEPNVTLSSSYMASLPKLVVVANGLDTVSVAIWVEVIGGTAHLYGAMRPSLLGSWTPCVMLTDGIEDVVGVYDLILNSAGQIVATWTSLESGAVNLRASKAIINLSNTWSAPVQINS